ncbi:hypothetical protein [Terasakiella sp. SH-1]|uniref:hypothetical protein n=1 Tax=Terasakiella sp. SH-1 TaxID=2560057 RepID=UPI0010736909|nr:hypothetical protein [Terasakiella sp. SH-1]
MRICEIDKSFNWKRAELFGLYAPAKNQFLKPELQTKKSPSAKARLAMIRAKKLQQQELATRRQIQNLMYQNTDITKRELEDQQRELELLKQEILHLIDKAEIEQETKSRIRDIALRHISEI